MLRTMKIILTPQQKQQLEEVHDSTRDGRVRDRIKAVLLASEGWNQAMISRALRIHESTIARHLIDYALSLTLLPMAKGFLYLVAIIDWYSRKVLSWRLSNTMDTSFCIEALEDALQHYGLPDIFNSD
jgi:transposase InsO family protein